MTLLSVAAAVGLAVCPPLVYAEQAWRIQERRDSRGFAKEVCGVLLCANGARVLWWFGVHYELALLVQALLMIAAQLFLLHLCLKFRSGTFASAAFSVSSSDRPGAVVFDATSDAPGTGRPAAPAVPRFQFRVDPPPEDTSEQGHHAPSHRVGMTGLSSFLTSSGDALRDAGRRIASLPQLGIQSLQSSSTSSRPLSFWEWPHYSTYLYVFAGYILVLGVLQLLLGWSETYNDILGTWAMGTEALLPIPQLLENQRRRSLSGFQLSVLAGWTFGDLFKSVYYIVREAPAQFTGFALVQLAVDLAICAQAYLFRAQTRSDDAAMAAEHGTVSAPPDPSPVAHQARSTPPPPPRLRGADEELELLPADVSDDEDNKHSSPRPLPKSQPFDIGDIEPDDEDS